MTGQESAEAKLAELKARIADLIAKYSGGQPC